jgi:hypothetical protein
MPWILTPPRKGRSPYWYVRGKYLGIALDRSTGTSEKRAATTILNNWKRQAERGEFSQPADKDDAGLFLTAVKAYLQAGGEGKFVEAISENWASKRLADIDQIAIDQLAKELYPTAAAATKNRQVYTPVSAILKHVGIEKKIKRPKGWRGGKRTFWLAPEVTFRLLDEAGKLDVEFGILCTLLNYCGLRLSEALREDRAWARVCLYPCYQNQRAARRLSATRRGRRARQSSEGSRPPRARLPFPQWGMATRHAR